MSAYLRCSPLKVSRSMQDFDGLHLEGPASRGRMHSTRVRALFKCSEASTPRGAPSPALTSRQASRVDHRGYSMYGPSDPIRAARWAVSLNWVDRCGAHSSRKSALLALY